MRAISWPFASNSSTPPFLRPARRCPFAWPSKPATWRRSAAADFHRSRSSSSVTIPRLRPANTRPRCARWPRVRRKCHPAVSSTPRETAMRNGTTLPHSRSRRCHPARLERPADPPARSRCPRNAMRRDARALAHHSSTGPYCHPRPRADSTETPIPAIAPRCGRRRSHRRCRRMRLPRYNRSYPAGSSKARRGNRRSDAG